MTECGEELHDADDDGGRVLVDAGAAAVAAGHGGLEDVHRVEDDHVHAAPGNKIILEIKNILT